MTRDSRYEPLEDLRATQIAEKQNTAAENAGTHLTNPTSTPPHETRTEADINSMIDLFQSTLRDLHNEAPIELLHSLRESLEHIRRSNPNSAHTAKACLLGLASDKSTLLHVLTAAYLVNGGVMLKQQPSDGDESSRDIRGLNEPPMATLSDLDFKELEEELSRIASDTLP